VWLSSILLVGLMMIIAMAGPILVRRRVNRLRCINLGSLMKGGQSRSRPVVDLQAPSLSG
jgi:hypothetical protein